MGFEVKLIFMKTILIKSLIYDELIYLLTGQYNHFENFSINIDFIFQNAYSLYFYGLRNINCRLKYWALKKALFQLFSGFGF